MARRLEEKGRPDAAAEEMEKALRLAPDSWEVNKEAGRLTKQRRDFAKAIEHYEKTVEVMETDFHSWALLVTCYQAEGRADQVKFGASKMVSEATKALQQDPSNGAALGILAGGHAILGDHERAREWIERAVLIDPDNLNMKYNFACVLAAYVGDTDEALNLLERALSRSGEMKVRATEADPDFDGLRDHPRYRKIIADARKRLGMKEPPAAAATAATASSRGS